ncbi:MAG: histidinol dehydrogenase [Chloroflexi bacterium]|nr:histidinol dehydrogenase [Chloroflexota bacterium]
MLNIYDVERARRTILRREPPERQNLPPALLEGVERIFGQGVVPSEAVARILASVREEGDQAVRRWSQVLDEVQVEELRIPNSDLVEASQDLPAALSEAQRTAADRIRGFHERQPLQSWTTEALGGKLGQRLTPIRRVGIYVPGGSAPLPSSLLMSVIPAQVAGVEEIVVCTPPRPHATILAAAHLCGLETVYQIGGAQAIAAMSYGTESLAPVDKIVGAGNLFVALAKQQVYGLVGLDGVAGPTETVIIADTTADPAWVAADLLAQAEHEPMASAILLTPDRSFAEAVQAEVARQIEPLSRSGIIAQSLSARGGIVLTEDLNAAAALVDEYAPEHLCLSVSDPAALADRIHNAGGIFLGERSFEVLGDYIAGPSHVMPTGGTARFASPLSALDFVKITSWIELDPETSVELSPLAAELAKAESLTAHASAAELRTEGENV